MRNRIISGEKIILVSRNPDLDAESFLYSRSDEDTLRQIGAYGKTYTLKNIVEGMKKESEKKDSIFLTILEKSSEEYLGDIRLLNINSDTPEIGIVILKKHRNKGFGTDTIQTITKYSFDILQKEKICLRVYKNNPKAKELYSKLNFNSIYVEDDGYEINGNKILEEIMILCK